MFIQTTQQTAPNIKVFRSELDPSSIWVRLSADTLISLSLEEAQQLFAGLTCELQVGLAAAKRVQS